MFTFLFWKIILLKLKKGQFDFERFARTRDRWKAIEPVDKNRQLAPFAEMNSVRSIEAEPAESSQIDGEISERRHSIKENSKKTMQHTINAQEGEEKAHRAG